MNVPGRQNDLWVKGRCQINLKYVLWFVPLTSLTSFGGGRFYLAQWLLSVCIWQRLLWIAYKTLGSNVKVKNTENLSYGLFVCLFVCLVALRPKSTAMVIAGRSVHLTTLFSWVSLNKQFTSNRAHTFACNWQQPFLNDSVEGRRMTVEIISWSISTKVWDLAGIELATPGSTVIFASVTRHVTDFLMVCSINSSCIFMESIHTCLNGGL